MSFVDAIILAVVEGITEFLPISSTGHMVLTAKLLSIPETDFVKTFQIVIQSGAILAVLALYGRTLLTDTRKLKKVLVAFIPTGILGLIFYKVVKDILIGNTAITLWALFLGGLAIIALEIYFKGKNQKVTINTLDYQKSFGVGLFQSISMIPGVSRSATTIIGGMSLGMNRAAAVELSFILAIPTMAAATGLDLLKNFRIIQLSELPVLLVGFVVAFIVALVVVKWFLGYVRTNNLIWFGVYRIILAAVFFLLVK